MKSHAALPHGEYLQRMRQVIGRLVEQHIAKTSTQNHAQHAEELQIVQQRQCRAAALTTRNAPAPEQIGAEKGDQIHQPVPAYGQRADGDGNRIVGRMNEHARYRWRQGRHPSRCAMAAMLNASVVSKTPW